MPDRSTVLAIADTTITVTTGASFTVFNNAGWHEPYLSLLVNVGTNTVINIEVSADDTNYVPATDVNGTALTALVADGYHILPGKLRFVRANVTGITAGTALVQIIKAAG